MLEIMMYDMYIVRRTQIWLEHDQHARLSQRADAERVTTSSLVRQAIDRYLDDAGADVGVALERFKAAVDAAAGSAPRLAEGRIYVERLRALDEDRQAELERRRRG